MTDDSGAWWRTATGYQIYPRSFCDSNGDGVGDIPGIVSKLDHLADLGVGFIWLSPVYASPMADNGYDISDYRAIAPEYGTLDDMDRLIAEARDRGIRIVMDLVVNHTSSAHDWFRAARASTEAPEHAYYIWRDPAPDGGPPSGLRAVFGGSAWTLVPEIGRYYLGYFSPEQPDLDWQNPALRREIYDMMAWWIARGIGGFRMDVVSLIGKDVDAGVHENGPHLHRFLKEMHREVLAGRDLLTVGESWSVTPETALDYCGRDRGELDMVFHFNHIVAGWDPVHTRFRPRPFDLVTFKRILGAWQAALETDGWNALFLSNHDLPRQVSKYGDDGEYRARSAKMLAIALHMMRGTPFVYQGEEIGMTNIRFDRIDQFRDIETIRHYRERIAEGEDPAAFLAGANAEGRDNARTPMQWSGAAQAGFTEGTPWIEVNPNHATVNVAADRARPDGVIALYRRLIALRRDMPVLTRGRFRPIAEDDPHVFAYTREDDGARLVTIANFSGASVPFDVPSELRGPGDCLVSSTEARTGLEDRIELAPYEGFALLMS